MVLKFDFTGRTVAGARRMNGQLILLPCEIPAPIGAVLFLVELRFEAESLLALAQSEAPGWGRQCFARCRRGLAAGPLLL